VVIYSYGTTETRVTATIVNTSVRNTYSQMTDPQSKELTAQEYADIIEELDQRGIHYNKLCGDDIHFKCDVNPYTPEPLTEIIELWNKIGNTWTFHGSTKTLIIKNSNFTLKK